MAEKKAVSGLQPVSAKHLHLIKWIPNEDSEKAKAAVKKLKISEAMAPIWRDVAKLIGLTQAKIKSIENPGAGRPPTACLDDVHEEWRQTDNEDYPYTWDGVKMLLQDTELQELSRTLEKALCSDSSTVKGNFVHKNSYELLTKKAKDNRKFLVTSAIILLGFFTLALFFYYPGYFNLLDQYRSNSLVYPYKIFVGRKQEMVDIMRMLDFNSNTDIRIVNIVGSPGFGKSTLAIHVGKQMVKQGIVVHYVNMAEYQVQQDVNLQEVLAEKILKAAEYTSTTFDKFLKELRNVFWNTLIIIDNCDDLVRNNNDTKFFDILHTLVEQSPILKVLITSRQVTIHLEYIKRYPLYELSKRASCELIERILPDEIYATTTEIEQVANLTGNAPLALQIIGALLSSPNPPLISEMIHELSHHPIKLLSSDALEHGKKINVSIFLSYHYLPTKIQKISHYLANFPGPFMIKTASKILNCTQLYNCSLSKSDSEHQSPVTESLNSLLSRSLIDFDPSQQRFTFHRLIKEFLREKQHPQDKEEFNEHFQEYYSSLLQKIVNTFDRDYKLALQIFNNAKHNYQKLLNDLKAKDHKINSFLKIIQSITQALEHPTFRVFSFSDEEIIISLKSALEYIEDKLSLNQKKKQIDSGPLVVAYVNILCKVIIINKDLSSFETALLMYTDKTENLMTFLTKFTNESESINYKTKVYEHLVKLYKVLEKHDKVTEYDTIIKGWKVESQNIGEIFYFLEMEFIDQEQSARAFKKINTLPALQRFNSWNAARSYFNENQQDKVEKCNEEMYSILDKNLLIPTEIYEEKSHIVALIKELKQINITIADKLKDLLIETILEIESHENLIKCSKRNDSETLSIIEDYFDQQNYSKTIELGEKFLKNLDLCSKYFSASKRIQGEILVAKATFWGEHFGKGMDQMEILYPIISTSYQNEFSVVCRYLIPRLRYIVTCYPEIYSIPHYIAMATIIAVFKIPPHHNLSNQEQTFQLPTSSISEIIHLKHSTFKLEELINELEQLNEQNYITVYTSLLPNLSPPSRIKINLKSYTDNLELLWSMIYYFYSKDLMIRFMVDVFLVSIRLNIFLFVIFRIILDHSAIGFFFVGANIIRLCMIVVFKFPNILLFPLTLVVINFMTRVLEFLFSCYLAVIRITPFIPRPWVYRTNVFNTLYYISLL